MKNIVTILVIMFLGALSLTVFGGDFGYVTCDELKAMMERNEPALVIIDSRADSQYEAAHIKGAINIPVSETVQNSTLPKAPKGAKLVFYCSGNT